MLALYKNIKARREALGWSQEDLAQKTGYTSRSSIAKIEKGMVDLPQTKIALFAEALGTTPSELMGWGVESPSTASDELDITNIKNIIPVPKMKKIPILGTIACGDPIYADENIDGYAMAPSHVDADFCLRCKGDSMVNARIYDGDIVYIHKQPVVENGEIAAVLIDDEATLKRVYIYSDKIVLQPENPLYAPIVCIHEEMNSVQILGKATHFTSVIK